jgi:hypothetical protein
MKHTDKRPNSSKPEEEIPTPTDPVETPVSPEVPEPSSAPEDPIPDPLFDGNYPV